MKILVLNRKLEKDEEVTLLTDSTPDNWRGKNNEKLEGVWKEATRIGTKREVYH